jgi:hypothetical protein
MIWAFARCTIAPDCADCVAGVAVLFVWRGVVGDGVEADGNRLMTSTVTSSARSTSTPNPASRRTRRRHNGGRVEVGGGASGVFDIFAVSGVRSTASVVSGLSAIGFISSVTV